MVDVVYVSVIGPLVGTGPWFMGAPCGDYPIMVYMYICCRATSGNSGLFLLYYMLVTGPWLELRVVQLLHTSCRATSWDSRWFLLYCSLCRLFGICLKTNWLNIVCLGYLCTNVFMLSITFYVQSYVVLPVVGSVCVIICSFRSIYVILKCSGFTGGPVTHPRPDQVRVACILIGKMFAVYMLC